MTETRAERLNTIVECLFACGQVGGCTRLMIAEALGLKKTPHITQMLRDIVAQGWATERMDTSKWPHRYRYDPTQKTLDWYAKNTAA